MINKVEDSGYLLLNKIHVFQIGWLEIFGKFSTFYWQLFAYEKKESNTSVFIFLIIGKFIFLRRSFSHSHSHSHPLMSSLTLTLPSLFARGKLSSMGNFFPAKRTTREIFLGFATQVLNENFSIRFNHFCLHHQYFIYLSNNSDRF